MSSGEDEATLTHTHTLMDKCSAVLVWTQFSLLLPKVYWSDGCQGESWNWGSFL